MTAAKSGGNSAAHTYVTRQTSADFFPGMMCYVFDNVSMLKNDNNTKKNKRTKAITIMIRVVIIL